MGDFFWIGTAIGAAIGLLNMLFILSSRLGQTGLNQAKTIWQGLWVWALWTVFGAYVLALWLLGVVFLGLSRILRRGSEA
ncbi:hypothetical protein [Ruegeria sp. Ofav3-42]|uniref:hypothetical protein n=1 Tax=Ruegeria sp. Ofav3-42 TaxID=2917759 RepID=UPI001EF6EAF5|nr:hypothetical protein [Ruegeria sp. Ofav3-42]MCG7522507.1 hypothetical protein [Ruegeria sp. Ofav3-42]